MSTLAAPACSDPVIRRVASMPSMPGIRMSISSTSGFSRMAISTASAPVAASPITCRSGAVSTRSRKLPAPGPGRRRRARGSCDRLARRFGWRAVQRQPRGDAEATPRQRPGVELAAEQAGPLAHSGDAVPRAGGGGTVAVVGDLQAYRVVGVPHQDTARGGLSVLDHVGQRLLDDPVGGQVDAGRHRALGAADLQLNPDPGVRGAGDELAHVGQAVCGRHFRARAVIAQDAEEPAHLAQRTATPITQAAVSTTAVPTKRAVTALAWSWCNAAPPATVPAAVSASTPARTAADLRRGYRNATM